MWKKKKLKIILKRTNYHKKTNDYQTQYKAKPKNSNCCKTQKVKLWQNSKTQIVSKLKNYNCDRKRKKKIYRTHKLKSWQNPKTQIVTKLKLWPNQISGIVTKLNSNCDKTQLKLSNNSWQTFAFSQFFLVETLMPNCPIGHFIPDWIFCLLVLY